MDASYSRRLLYPPIRPTRASRLAVGHGHDLYVEECGRADGLPVITLPAGWADGLPLGFQFIAPFGADELLLSWSQMLADRL